MKEKSKLKKYDKPELIIHGEAKKITNGAVGSGGDVLDQHG